MSINENDSNNKQPPCKGCIERIMGCHSKCPYYTEWKLEQGADKIIDIITKKRTNFNKTQTSKFDYKFKMV